MMKYLSVIVYSFFVYVCLGAIAYIFGDNGGLDKMDVFIRASVMYFIVISTIIINKLNDY
jgi:hypothetical protein